MTYSCVGIFVDQARLRILLINAWSMETQFPWIIFSRFMRFIHYEMHLEIFR